tara:strand:- start:1310 stop:1594 length:285 start_codon:yes stop_codon:yes gene_type:complete
MVSVEDASTVTFPVRTTVPFHVVLVEIVESADINGAIDIPSRRKIRTTARERMDYAGIQAISMQGIPVRSIQQTCEEWACPDLNWGLTAPSRQV